jgi:hypothetical protein
VIRPAAASIRLPFYEFPDGRAVRIRTAFYNAP